MPRHVTALVLALLAVTACPAATGPRVEPIHVAGTYEHPASGLRFPEQVGGFRRAEINQFDRDGLNIGVGYNYEEADASIALTVYVRRPLVLEKGELASLGHQFAIERYVIHQYHRDVSEVWSQDVEISDSDRSFPGYAAEFHYNEFFNFAERDVVSFLYLFDRDGWVVKYRITYAERQQSASGLVFGQLLKIAPWGTCAAYRCTGRRF